MSYDSKYINKEFYWGLKPHKFVVNTVEVIPPHAKVLDLGCGEGRNAFFLAQNTFDVTAVDSSQEGIHKLISFAKQEGLDIQAEVSDIRLYLQHCEIFDAIFAINVLQFIDGDTIFDTIAQMQDKTSAGGFNIISAFVAETAEQKEELLLRGRYLFDEGELQKLYADWDILLYKETLGDWETHGEAEHRHFKVRIIAQKR